MLSNSTKYVKNGSWYLIFTKPKSELKAQENLNRQGYKTYLPMSQQSRRRNGKNVTVVEAFFPRYLFIKLDCKKDNWAPINSTIGVSELVRFGGIPAIVPNNLIDELKINDDSSGLQKFVINKIKPGDNVSIVDGLFAGRQGIYKNFKSFDRVVILLDVVGQNTQVTLSSHELKLAEYC